jgi:hypothetical protein
MLNGVSLDQVLFVAELYQQIYITETTPDSFTQLTRFGGLADRASEVVIGTSSGTLYILLRGSMTCHDIARSIQYGRSPLLFGECHQGALIAARYIVERCHPFIDGVTGPIVVTGHSLGGCYGMVVATILRLEENRPNVTAIFTGAMPALSANLQEATKPFITSFVYRNDIVPLIYERNASRIADMVSGREPPERKVQALATGILQIFLGHTSGEDDPFLLECAQAVLDADYPEDGFHGGGVIFRMTEKEGDGLQFRPYDEGKELNKESLPGMADHPQGFYLEAFRSIKRVQ